MKILLLGEFSGLHKYLKEGIQQLGGHEVMLYANGDGWKIIGGADGSLHPVGKCKIRQFYRAYSTVQSFRNYDVVQFINTMIYSRCFVNSFFTKKIMKGNKLISLCAAGSDYAQAKAYKEGRFEYHVFDYAKDCLKTYVAKNRIKNDIKIVNNANVIIPSCYEYQVAYEDNSKCINVIPFPINIDSIRYQENIVGSKIVFFHGLNRELEKGTPFIREALNRLKTNYPNDVEIVLDGHMPFDKYMDVLSRTNVVIDQCCAYGYGINACVAMGQGKVVMAGAKKESIDSLGAKDSPIIHIKPDVDWIYSKLVYVLENKDKILQWGYQSRKYIEEIHDYKKVALKYIKAWKAKN